MPGVTQYLQVRNTGEAIGWYQRVFDAEEIHPLADWFHGDRAGRIHDPFGHHWIIATRPREVPEAETVDAFNAMFGRG